MLVALLDTTAQVVGRATRAEPARLEAELCRAREGAVLGARTRSQQSITLRSLETLCSAVPFAELEGEAQGAASEGAGDGLIRPSLKPGPPARLRAPPESDGDPEDPLCFDGPPGALHARRDLNMHQTPGRWLDPLA